MARLLTTAEQFFYDHAGYSWFTATETPEQGHIRCAHALAVAEQYAKDHGWSYEWIEDQDGCSGCACESKECACSTGEPHETLVCILRDSEPSCYDSYGRPAGGSVLVSLGGICGSDRDYGRVVEAELALEAMPKERYENGTR